MARPWTYVFNLIEQERQFQLDKCGEQRHDGGKWLLILTEEIGEAAQAFLGGDRVTALDELVQAAAVIVAWLEPAVEPGPSSYRDQVRARMTTRALEWERSKNDAD